MVETVLGLLGRMCQGIGTSFSLDMIYAHQFLIEAPMIPMCVELYISCMYRDSACLIGLWHHEF